MRINNHLRDILLIAGVLVFIFGPPFMMVKTLLNVFYRLYAIKYHSTLTALYVRYRLNNHLVYVSLVTASETRLLMGRCCGQRVSAGVKSVLSSLFLTLAGI